MTRRAARLAAIVPLAAWLAAGPGCDRRGARTEPAGAEVVARWQGGALTADDVRAEMARLSATARARLSEPGRKRELVDRLIATRLLRAEGERRGYASDPAIVREVEALRDRLVVQRLLADLRARPVVSDDEVRRYYDENPALYSTTRVRASHILLADEAAANAVYAEAVAHPERFADLARERSLDQASARRGGDLGFFGAGRMEPAFERAAFALAPGEISRPVQTRYGWHVIRVTERQDGPPQPFESVRASIETLLANQKVEARVEELLATLRRTAGVAVDEERLRALEPPADAAPAGPHGAPRGH